MHEPPQLTPLDVKEQWLYCPATLQRKLISAACIQNLVLSVMTIGDLHPSGFTHSCEPPQCMLWVLARGGQQDHVICKKKRQNPLVPKPDPLWPLAGPRNPVH
ncbi:hypothetical protein GOODEAATRI_028238 [Goodea atripinnis]|uniref:Uncharacterized protein n=1 Tax=Goodea atripinnis TaxID=208336 RepID=A0ABV0PHQ4_9TELE